MESLTIHAGALFGGVVATLVTGLVAGYWVSRTSGGGPKRPLADLWKMPQ